MRTVIDHEKGGTKVSAEIFKADDDTAFPLLTAMGIEMTQTLFVGEHTLLLEGPSDLIYLDVLSDLAESRQAGPGWTRGGSRPRSAAPGSCPPSSPCWARTS